MLSLARAVIDRIDDARKMQELQIDLLAGEPREQVERMQEYGFTSVPKKGAEALAVFLGGNRDHGVVIACDDRRFRLKNLIQGEVALYDDLGNVFHLRRDKVLVKAKAQVDVEALEGVGVVNVTALTAINLTAPVINLNGAVNAGPSGGGKPGLKVDDTEASLTDGAGQEVELNQSTSRVRILSGDLRFVEV